MNIDSLKAKLLVLAKASRIDFQVMLDRFVAEQFLARLGSSDERKNLIFKGGSLLFYIIETNRKTRDIDFSVVMEPNSLDAMLGAIKSVLKVDLDDGIKWEELDSATLEHPDLEENGLRVTYPYSIGKMKGKLLIDLARGDQVEGVPTLIQRMRYKELPLVGTDFLIQAYPPEFVFAEKLYVAVTRGSINSRMKDYYDLLKLSNALGRTTKLTRAIETTFKNRGYLFNAKLEFGLEETEAMEKLWRRFHAKENLNDAPEKFAEVVVQLNNFLKRR